MNRLKKLALKSATFEQFKTTAIHRSSWFLRPYVEAGYTVDAVFINKFWNVIKGIDK